MSRGDGQCTGCCSFPHGQASIWTLLFGIIAYCFAINASYGCFFVRIDVPEDSPIRPLSGNSTAIGLLSYSDPVQEYFDGINYACTTWGNVAIDYYFDHAWRSARAFGIMANVFIGVPTIACFLMTCMSLPRLVLRIMTYMMFFGSFCEALTFIAFASEICTEYNCIFELGAGLAVGGVVSSFIAGIFYHHCMPADDSIPASATAGGMAKPPGTVTVTETVEPDGTMRTVKTTVNADGSQTVEETIQRPQ